LSSCGDRSRYSATVTVSRRKILGLGLGASALVAGCGLGLGLWPGRVDAPPAALLALSPRGWTILSSVADTLCLGGAGLPSAAQLDIASALDVTMSTLHPGDIADFEKALLLVDNALAGLLFDGRARPFTLSDAPTRVATLERWRTSRLHPRRQVYKAIRGLVMAAYWGHPRLYAASGYPGPPNFGQADAPEDDLVSLAAVGRPRLLPPQPDREGP